MGISGLLPLLKSIHKPCNLKKFAGQTIGVDAYGWLHRGTAACAIDLALAKPTTKYIDFCMNRVRMLIHFGITPYLIFDGDNLPSKAGTEKDRRERRKEGKRLGLELLRVGKTSQAQLELQKAVDVTPEMARAFIEELKASNVQYIVAPYEADSQMVYLERKGIIDGILSEDSDLLVFGAKCLITKLDKYGDCVEVNRNHFTACREISLVGWSDADFRRMAILSGCDYLPGIGGLGLKTAHRMLRKHKTVDRLVKAAQFDGKLKVPNGFMADFDQAEKTFLYQWVFCPIENQLVNLTPLPDGVDIADMPYLGEEVAAHLAAGVAKGDLYPRTKLPMTVASKVFGASRRASTHVQTPDLKGTKSIDSFFKPKRTPLAELDPNIFTPSPSQQVLLEQQRNSTGWAAVPAPGSQSTSRPSVPSTAPQPARRIISDPTGRRRSAPHPSKRQRLCSDSILTTPSAGGEGVVRSQFFASTMPEPSPSIRPTKNNRRKTDYGFELYSDDSLGEAMAEAADLEETASQSKKKLRIFSDTQSDSQSTATTRTPTGESQDSTGILTPATSFGSPEPESVSSAAISSQMKELRSKFTYKGPESSFTSSISTMTSKLRRRDTEARTPSALPLELFSMTAQETKVESIVPGTPPPVDEQPDIENSAWAAIDSEIVVPASSPPVTPAKRRRSSLKGSEDLIVHDSDGESVSSPRKPMFNLNRFAFTG
ncbi:PIN domain-like protein [Macroventuria anomochaeta]|uniref:PIN domain-like protein n=1 Tax=Macroventuria anomochaeta TaxID=301207 RepID=A0ACB6RND5_9PLEO|nr:PIN domain-like protein [Macroventuria anomochaeta]KAF2623441.1 PIN domain-like protein [Macroventuria anomochaeta]